jgi:hypothetical protein
MELTNNILRRHKAIAMLSVAFPMEVCDCRTGCEFCYDMAAEIPKKYVFGKGSIRHVFKDVSNTIAQVEIWIDKDVSA